VEDIVVACGRDGIGGGIRQLDLETTVMGVLDEMFYFLSLVYSRLLSGFPGGYNVDGVLACMDDVALLTIDGVWGGD
jgi:hypothetical protein